MGRVFLQEFHKTPENCFHLCLTCQAHIALFTDFDYFTDDDVYGIIVSKAINVHTLGPEQNRRVGDRVVADVYCNNCCNRLGIKFIEVRNNDTRVKEMDFLLLMSKLATWNGTLVI